MKIVTNGNYLVLFSQRSLLTYMIVELVF